MRLRPPPLLVAALLTCTSSVAAAQCLEAYVLEPVPGNPPQSAAKRSVILVHGFEVMDNVRSMDEYLTLSATERCDRATSRSAVAYWHAGTPEDPGARWSYLARELQSRGIRVFAWRWPTQYAISTAAKKLKDAVSTEPSLAGDELILVGHSMGGLVSLAASAQQGLTPVIRVVTLGAPLRGTTFAGWAKIFSESVAEVAPGSPFLRSLEAARSATDPLTYALGGKVDALYDCTLRFGFAVDPSDDGSDCVVSVASAYDVGGTTSPNRVYNNGLPFLHYGHTQIKADYTGGGLREHDFPRDVSFGTALVETLQRLIVSELAPSILLSSSSVSLSTSASSQTISLTNGNPGSIVQLHAQVTSAPAGADWLSWRFSSTSASAAKPAQLTFEASAAGLVPGTYSATVAVEGYGSSVAFVTVLLSVPNAGAPSLTVPGTGIAGTPYEVSWTAVSGATSYTLERSTDGSWTDQVPSISTTGTYYTDVIYLSSGSKKRYYRVRANNSGFSSTRSITVTVPTSQLTVVPNPLRFFGFTRDTILQSAKLELTPASSWGASAYNTSGGTWLEVPSPRSGAAGKSIRVDARAENISVAGTYAGRVEITCCGSTALAATVPASFTIYSASDSRMDLVADTAWVNYGYNNPALPQNRDKTAEVLHRIRNAGSRDVFLNPYGEARYAIYWSADSTPPSQARVDAGSSMLLETGPINKETALAASGVVQLREHITLPSGAYTSGTSYLSFVVDASDHDLPHPSGAIPEANEANNIRIIPLRIPLWRQVTTSPTLALGEVFADSAAIAELLVENPGDAALDWSATASRTGISIAPGTGTILGHSSVRLAVRADGASLGMGAQGFTLSMVTSLGTVTVSGSATVVPRPVINAVLRKAQFRGSAPDSTILRITNDGGGTLDWAATSDSPWLTVSRESGIAGDSSWIHVDPSQLSTGSHEGTLRIDAGFASNRPVSLAVTMAVEAVLRGDVTGDGLLKADDAQALLNILAGVANPGAVHAMPNGDADCNGKLEARDVQLILMKIAGRPTSPACVGTVR